jgi:hypothetical protein
MHDIEARQFNETFQISKASFSDNLHSINSMQVMVTVWIHYKLRT